MKRRVFLAVTAAAVFSVSAPGALLGQAAVPGSALVADKGAFRILLRGAEIGAEQFESGPVSGGWAARGETVYRLPGAAAEIRSSGELRVSPEGAPLRYTWTAQSDKKISGSVEFEAGTAKTSTDLGGKEPFQQDFLFSSPRVAVLDNNLYHQYAFVASLYNWNSKGPQTLPVLIPQDMTPGSLTVESLGTKTVEGTSFEALRITSADIEIVAYFDPRRRLMRLEIPAADVAVVRR